MSKKKSSTERSKKLASKGRGLQQDTKKRPKKGPQSGPQSGLKSGPRKSKPSRSTPSGRSIPSHEAAAIAGAAAAGAVGATAAEEEWRGKLNRLQSDFNRLHDEMLLTRVHDEMSDIQTTLSMLPTQIEALRTRGYVFRNYLERKIDVLAEQWKQIQGRVTQEISRRTRELSMDSDVAERALQLAVSGNQSQLMQAESAIRTLESKVRAAQSAVEAMYSSLRENVNQTRSQVEEIKTLLDRVDEASFQLRPAEDPIASCKAQYFEQADEGPEGILYLTDARLLFERKEEVATKKFLFITTEKETVKEFVFEVSVGHIDEIEASDQRKFLRRKEMLELLFSPDADLNGATLRLLDAKNEDWAMLIGRVKSGEIAKERTQPKDEAVVEAVQSAPTKCPTCGATLSVEIVRGMSEITCEYCGSVIRL